MIQLTSTQYKAVLAALCPYCRAGLTDSLRVSDREMFVHFIPGTEWKFDCAANAIRGRVDIADKEEGTEKMAMNKGYGNQETVKHKPGGETTSEKQEGSGNHLMGAVKELYAQHPHNYDDLGPHQGTTDHVRHKPVVSGKRNPEDPVMGG